MSSVKRPRSLRSCFPPELIGKKVDSNTTRNVTVGCLVAVASITGAEAQQAPLAPVTVDAPVARKKPAATTPTAEQLRVRNALRRAARAKQAAARAKPAPAPAIAAAQPPDQNPYADPAAPYKADRLQASGKFPEPILNTPKTVTVLTKELLEDKNATSLKQAVLSTAGVTFGSARGATPSAIASSSAVSTPATTSSSTAFATPVSASVRTSSPSRSRFSAVRLRHSRAAAPRAAPSTL